MDGWFVGRGGGLLSPRLRDDVMRFASVLLVCWMWIYKFCGWGCLAIIDYENMVSLCRFCGPLCRLVSGISVVVVDRAYGFVS